MPMPKHLNRVGLSVFMTEYEYFASRPQRADAITYLVQKGISNENGAGHRASGAKYLFDDPDLLCEALEYVAYKSLRASNSEKEKSLRLLTSLSTAKRI